MWFKDVLEELRILNDTLLFMANREVQREKDMPKETQDAGLYHPLPDALEHYKIERDEAEKLARRNPYYGLEELWHGPKDE